MKHYYQVEIEHLDIIRQKAIDLLPESLLQGYSITRNIEIENKLFEIKELQAVISRFGGMSMVHSMAFNISRPFQKPGLHVDDGTFIYSFNIPLLNYENTFLNVYEKVEKLIMMKHRDKYDNVISYWGVRPEDCKLIEKIETVHPHFLNTKFPHSVENENDLIRFNMLIRFKPEFDPSVLENMVGRPGIEPGVL